MNDGLVELLELTPLDMPDAFAGAHNGPSGKRAYGGLLTAQALAAAGGTVGPGFRPTSLHAQFLRGGDAGAPVRYDVERIYDGRT